MLHLPKINRCYLICGLAFIYLIWPTRFAMIYYEHLNANQIEENLVRKTTNNLSLSKDITCDYRELLEENQWFYKKPLTTDEIFNTDVIRPGGKFFHNSLNKRTLYALTHFRRILAIRMQSCI